MKSLRQEIYNILIHSLPDTNTNTLSFLARKIEELMKEDESKCDCIIHRILRDDKNNVLPDDFGYKR